jgi:hypothetical protein
MLTYIYSSLKGGLRPLSSGSKLRHWPPGTNSSTVRAAFFCADEIDGQALNPTPGLHPIRPANPQQ